MPASDSRTLRIFISSTFRDMHAERELLVKRVFPEIRRLCAERFVTFTEVDLRWGITGEQAAEGQVLPICLDEIERSRPFFIGLLGERYGWIADDIPQEVIAREPWLQEHAGARTSVTELEILHGVIRKPPMHGRAYFYFRDPGYPGRLPPGSQRADFESESPEARQKLARLKTRIREAADTGVCRVMEPYADPAALAEAVRADLIELIDWRYPTEAVPDPLAQEAQGHAAYGQSKRFAYVDRPAHTAAVDAAVAGDGPPVVVTGESGGGKTALLASWAARWAARHPDDVVFEHYFGATPQSASVSGFLQRLLGELKRRYDIGEEVPVQPDKLREALPLWLARTVDRVRIVLVLDGLNQIDGDEPDRRLEFVPHHFPPNVRAVASVLPGLALDALRERGWAEHVLPSPDAAERDRMIGEFLDTYRKTLHPDLRRQLVAAPGASNPLFLRTVLEELRQFGGFEALPARVEHYLEADTPEELFRRVLRRWQDDFDAGQDLVRHAATFLWAARQGLAEAEWLELLGSTGQPLARQIWRPLFLAMEPHLAQRAGLYAFGHEFLRRAMEVEYLSSDSDRRHVHRTLARHFEREPFSPRKARELPYQLLAAGRERDLLATLIDWTMFSHLLAHERFVLLGYWKQLESNYDPAEEYESAWAQSWTPDAGTAAGVAERAAVTAIFFRERGQLDQAEVFLRRARDAAFTAWGQHDPRTVTVLNNLAVLLVERGERSHAALAAREAVEAETLRGSLPSPAGVHATLLAAVLSETAGDLASKEHAVRQALGRLEMLEGPDSPGSLNCLVQLAHLLQQRGATSQAHTLYREAIDGLRRTLGHSHPDTARAMVRLGNLLREGGRLLEARRHLEQALCSLETVRGRAHRDVLECAFSYAVVLAGLGETPAVEQVVKDYFKGIDLARSLGAEHPITEAIRSLHRRRD